MIWGACERGLRTMFADRMKFEIIEGHAARDIAIKLAKNCFQHASWVQAVGIARKREHRFIAIQAANSRHPPAYLFGALHRRCGLSAFESMPMGGYGGWCCERPLELDEERDLIMQWLRQTPWPLVQLTSEPGRNLTLPQPPSWPFPNGVQQRIKSHDYETHVLGLVGDDAELLSRSRSGIRSYLRRVDQLGFNFRRGHEELLPQFCEWYRRGSQGWQQQATGLLSDEFFAALCNESSTDVWIVSHDCRPVGAAVFLLGKQDVQYQASGSTKLPGPVSAIDALMWTAVKHYRDCGFRSMNMGASEGLTGVRRFKEKFGAVPVSYRRVTYVLPWAAGVMRAIRGRLQST